MNKILAALVSMLMILGTAAPIMADTGISEAEVDDDTPVIVSLNAPTSAIILDPGSISTTTDTTITVTINDDNGDDDLATEYTAKIWDVNGSAQVGSDITLGTLDPLVDDDDAEPTSPDNEQATYSGTGGAIPYDTAPSVAESQEYAVKIYYGETEILPDNDDVLVTITIAETKSLSLTQDIIYFGTVMPDTSNNEQTDDDTTDHVDESIIYAWNDGNVDTTPSVGTPSDLSGSVDVIPGSSLTSGSDTFSLITPTSSDSANFLLDVPAGILAGSYSGTVIITVS